MAQTKEVFWHLYTHFYIFHIPLHAFMVYIMMMSAVQTKQCQIQDDQYITHETAICPSSLIHNLQETENTWQILNRPILKHVTFSWNRNEKQFFCGSNIFIGLFVNQLHWNAGISVWQIVWVTISAVSWVTWWTGNYTQHSNSGINATFWQLLEMDVENTQKPVRIGASGPRYEPIN
jgi:hypothetical protein